MQGGTGSGSPRTGEALVPVVTASLSQCDRHQSFSPALAPTCNGNVRRSMNLTVPAPLLTSAFWCSRRSAGDGIVFGVLAAGGDDDAANCPFRRRPAVAA